MQAAWAGSFVYVTGNSVIFSEGLPSWNVRRRGRERERERSFFAASWALSDYGYFQTRAIRKSSWEVDGNLAKKYCYVLMLDPRYVLIIIKEAEEDEDAMRFLG